MRGLRTYFYFLLVSLPLLAQRTEPPAPDVTIRTGTQEVLLDLVVRDKKERSVRDLTKDDIEVYENGVRQEIRGFQLRDGRLSTLERERASAMQKAGVSYDPLRQINLITIVMSRMSVEGRRTSYQIVEDLLKNDLGPNTYIAIYTAGRRMHIISPYSNNIAQLRTAASRAAKSTETDLNDSSAEITKYLTALLVAEAANPNGQPSGGAAGERGPFEGRPIGAVPVFVVPSDASVNPSQASIYLSSVGLKMMEHMQSALGQDTLDQLQTIIDQQAQLPGRKTVIYLSPGVKFPPSFQERIDSVISSANRRHVTFYTVDVNGLTLSSSSAYSNYIMSQNMTSAASGLENAASTPGIGIDADVAGRHLNEQENMAELAERTGGFMIANTNDRRSMLSRIMEDARSHYEITYTPTDPKMDGAFRKISVKLKRPNLSVQTRNGYFALPEANGVLIAPFEVAALQALNAQKLPKSFDYRSAALRFAPQEGREQVTVVFETPFEGLKLTPISGKQVSQGHVSLLALIKSSDGQVVEKISHDQPFQVPDDKRDALKRGNFVYSQPVTLDPGRYTLETAVVDREAMTASAKKSVLIVTKPSGALALSQMTLVRRVDPTRKDPEDPNPFAAPDGFVTPALTDTVPANAQGALQVYFVAYAPATSKPEAFIELSKDGQRLALTPAQLPAPQPNGARPYLASIPMQALSPGDYQLRAVLKDGDTGIQETKVFHVQ